LLFATFDALGSILFWPARAWLGRHKQSEIYVQDVKRILLVQLDHLGDVVITLRTLHALQARFPQAAIDVLCSPWTAELFEAYAGIRRIFVSANNRFCRPRRWTWWLSSLRWGIRLKRHRYDMAFDVRGEAPLAALLWLSRTRYRVGWNCGGGCFLLTHSPEYVRGRSEYESRTALWSAVKLRSDRQGSHAAETPLARSRDTTIPEKLIPANLAFYLDIDDAARRQVERRMATLAHKDHPRIVLHMGAGTAAKRWPVEHWRGVIEHIVTNDLGSLILVGTHDERHLASAVLAKRNTADTVDWTGKLSVIELAHVLEQVDLFVGADSGPAHLAAAMRTPTVVLFSGTNDARQWKPQGSHVRVVRHDVDCGPCHRSECVWSDHRCMRGIAPLLVIEAIADVLKEFDLASEGAIRSDVHSRHPRSCDIPVICPEYVSNQFA